MLELVGKLQTVLQRVNLQLSRSVVGQPNARANMVGMLLAAMEPPEPS